MFKFTKSGSSIQIKKNPILKISRKFIIKDCKLARNLNNQFHSKDSMKFSLKISQNLIQFINEWIYKFSYAVL